MRSGRAAAPIALVVATMTVALALTAGCSAAEHTEPTLPSANFTAKLVLEVNDDGFHWRHGDHDDPAVTVDPAAVPFGTVVDVVNTGRSEHWVDGGKGFDTGRLQPGEKTVVAFTSDTLATVGATAQTFRIVDRDHPEHTTQITVTPKAAAG
jgi:hypothetical protein